jgi:BlaI family transcriptional regulator, penicillinase repressor
MAQFTPGELNIMRLLWEHGELKPGDLQARFPEPIKNSALRSYLTILLQKGHVSRRKAGKAFFYKAVTRRESAFRTTLREFVNVYCGGSTQALLLNLISSEKLSERELVALKRLADESEAASSTPPRKRK